MKLAPKKKPDNAPISNEDFNRLESDLKKLLVRYQTRDYRNGGDIYMHHSYANEYDRTLERYGISKKDFVAEVRRRLLASKQSA